MATRAQIEALSAAPGARIGVGSDTQEVHLIPPNTAGSGGKRLRVEQDDLVWRLRQSNPIPGQGFGFTSSTGAVVTITASSGFGPSNPSMYPYYTGSVTGVNRPSYVNNVAGLRFHSNFGATAENGDGLTASSSAWHTTTGGNFPVNMGPAGGTWTGPASFNYSSATFKAATGGIRAFFAANFFTNFMPRNFFNSSVGSSTGQYGAGGNGARGSKQFTVSQAGTYLIKFRVPGRLNTSVAKVTYDLLIQDKRDGTFHSLIELGGADYQQEFTATGDAVNTRGAKVYQYLVRMNANQIVRLVLRQFKTTGSSGITAFGSGTVYPGTDTSTGTGVGRAPARSVRFDGSSLMVGTSASPAKAHFWDADANGAENPHDDERQYWLELYKVSTE